MMRPSTPSLRPTLASVRVGAALLAGLSGWAQALTLGPFSVESALGQPLRAAVEITQYRVEDLQKLTVKLAEPASFEQAGMRFHPALVGLQARLEFRGDGKPYMALIGTTPVTEHFIDVIVEAQWPSGRLAMNYTLLVSPVGAPKAIPDLNPKVGPAGAPVTASLMPPVVSSQPTGPVSLARPAPAREGAIRVRPGDSASRLLTGRLPADVTLDQMLVAMVRANPEAFIEGNVNLLREGAQVQLPSAQEAAQTPAAQARQTVIAQTLDFAAYAQRLAQASQRVTGSASPALTEATRPAAPTGAAGPAAKDQLTLSPPDTSADSAEARLAVEREIQDKTEQLAALKKNLESLKSLSAASAATHSPPTANPSLPAALAEPASLNFLDQVSRHPDLWTGVLALLASMGAVVWWVRRPSRPAPNLFETNDPSTPASMATAAPPATSPFASGLPPQFAGLDLNLGPAPEAPPASQATEPPEPRA